MATTFKIEINWTKSAWSDETRYVKRVQIRSGFERNEQPVAAPGSCRVVLDNATRRFSPEYLAGPLFGDLLPRREVKVSASDGVTTWVLFRGFIERIEPAAGEHSRRECVIECVDGLTILQRQRVNIVLEESKAVGEAVSAVVGLAYTPPAGSYSDNGDHLAKFGRGWLPERTTSAEALRDICEALYGRFFIARDGTATFLTRDDRLNVGDGAALTLAGTDPVSGLAVTMDVNRVCNLAQVTLYPTETVDAVQVVWTARTTLYVPPGSTRTIFGNFRDDNGERVTATDLVEPVAGTDYVCEYSGVIITNLGFLTVTPTIEATRVMWELENSSRWATIEVTKLQIRGKPIRVYDPMTVEQADTASQTAYEVRATRLDLPMLSDLHLAQSYVQYLVGRFATPIMVADSFEMRDRSLIEGVNVFSLDLFDKVVIDEVETGLDGAEHFIRSVEYDIRAGGVYKAVFHLERSDDRRYCFLSRGGYCELDQVRVGF